jgi:hypothetical protein
MEPLPILDAKPYRSHTQLDLACKCPVAFCKRYVEGKRRPPGIAMLRGRACHSAVEHNFRQKIETWSDLAVSDVVDYAVAQFDGDVAREGVQLTGDEQSAGVAASVGRARDAVVDTAEVFASNVARDYQPVLVEHDVTIELDGPSDLRVVLDVADIKDRVTDFKSMGRSPNELEIHKSIQLTCEAAAFRATTGRMPTETNIDAVVRTATTTKRKLVRGHRDATDFDVLARRMNAVERMIETGSFVPAWPGHWLCSPRWCGYWNECEFVNSERIERATP